MAADEDREHPTTADRDPASPTRSKVPTLVLGIALLGAVGAGWVATRPDPEPKLRFCTAEGYLTQDGHTLGHDNERGCAWVDEDGNLVDPPPD